MQSRELPRDPAAHHLGRHFVKPLFQLPEINEVKLDHVSVQAGRAFEKSSEGCGPPNERAAVPDRLRRRGVLPGGDQSGCAESISRRDQSKDCDRAAFSEFRSFYAAGEKEENLFDGVAFKEEDFTAVEFPAARSGEDLGSFTYRKP